MINKNRTNEKRKHLTEGLHVSSGISIGIVISGQCLSVDARPQATFASLWKCERFFTLVKI